MFCQCRKILLFFCMFSLSTLTVNAQSWIIETFDGGTGNEEAYDLVSHANGEVTRIGLTTSYGSLLTAPNVRIVKNNPLLGVLWSQVYDIQVATPGSVNIPHAELSLVECFNGDFLWATGVHTNNPNQADIIICRTDNAGLPIWTQILGKNNLANDLATSVIEDPNTGDIYVTGYSDVGGVYDAIVAKLDGAGNPQWNMRYGGNDIDRGRCIRLLNSGDLVIAGETRSFTNSWDGLQFSVDPSGVLLWANRYGHPFPYHEGFQSIMEHPNGRLFACGASREAGTMNFSSLVVETDPAALGAYMNSALYDVAPNGPERAWHITQSYNGIQMVLCGEVPGAFFGGTSDAFFMEIDPGLGVTQFRVYGTDYKDLMRCVEYTPGDLINTLDGYFLVGTTAVALNDDDYAIRTNRVGKSGCDIEYYANPIFFVDWSSTPIASATYTSWDQETLVNGSGDNAQVLCPGQDVDQYAPKAGTPLEPSQINVKALSMEIGPQPLTIGSELNLQFTLDRAADLEISLFDMHGRQVYTLPFSAAAGENATSFVPGGLSSGTYVLRFNGMSNAPSLKVMLVE